MTQSILLGMQEEFSLFNNQLTGSLPKEYRCVCNIVSGALL
jgi:hypothetical protein